MSALHIYPPEYSVCEPRIVREKVDALVAAYKNLIHLSAERKQKLEDYRKLHLFQVSISEELGWIKEKEQSMSSDDFGRELTIVLSLLARQKVRLLTGLFQ